MIKINQKIKAFTLTEVMVVIVISTIVVGLAFSVLKIVQESMSNIDENYEYKEEMQSFEVALTIDFNRLTSVKWNPYESTLSMYSPIEEKEYKFFSDSIVTAIHTYPLQLKEKKFYFEGEPVNSGDVDAMKLTFYNTRELHRVFVFKYNDPTIHF
ncbi:prepilin-type N-terminal cleavage/methylation domain-containing protein [Aquimarina sp. I32.4]|uniref:prepilin-type N-terminal cleavage/methylation domain-containing protein n=1 Tax=Aquimarina sp. I32.4 TaxID=2053903 RepID=UPI000CDEC48E|nr:prepilin-type N-terminal cleavage/methylation domain-containing protein [Aquimarina sp. I32.4]